MLRMVLLWSALVAVGTVSPAAAQWANNKTGAGDLSRAESLRLSRNGLPSVAPLLQDPFFRRFFDLPEQTPKRSQVSAGSGVIVDAEQGYVLTARQCRAAASDSVANGFGCAGAGKSLS